MGEVRRVGPIDQGLQSGEVKLDDLDKAGISFKDLQTTQSSLEDIFVSLVREKK